jgi:hypothetical protein
MVRDSDSFAGILKANSTWLWAFDQSGSLITGSVPWTGITGKPTTVAGYGITDAITTANIGSQSVASAVTASTLSNANVSIPVTGISYFNGGNVGIGTSTPSQKLTVSGATLITGDLTVQGKVITDTLVNRTVANVSISGSILPDVAAPAVYRDIGATANRWNNLYLSGTINAAGTITAPTFVGNLSGNATTATTATNSTQLGGIAAASYALLASPAFTSIPTAPTAAVNTSTTQLATTAYVNAEIANDAPSKTGT